MKRLFFVSIIIMMFILAFSSCKKNKPLIVTPVADESTSEAESDSIQATEDNETVTEEISSESSSASETAETQTEPVSASTTIKETSTTKPTTTKIIQHSVTLSADGIDGYPKTYKVTQNSTINLPAPAKTGYTFDGWYTSKDGGNKFTSSTKINEDTLLYAHWKANVYTVTLINEGSVYDTISAEYGSSVSLPTPSSRAYNFNGWYTSDGEIFTSSTRISKDITLYSKWTLKEFTVSFNSNGGDQSYSSVTVSYGSTINLPTPTRTGYNFVGWFDSNSSGSQYTSSTPITSSITLYARWDAKTYTVYFDSCGGTPSYKPLTIKYGGTVNLPSPTKEGYDLAGWYTSASGGTKYTSSTKITGDVTLYAVWNKKTYTIIFDSNGGTSINSQKVEYGTTFNLPTPKKSGYTFDGWYTSPNGGTKYASSVKITSSTTFYAHWTANPESNWVDTIPSGASKTQTRIVYRYKTRSTEPVYTTKTQYQYAYYACNKCGTRWYGPCYHSELGSSCSGYITGPYTAWFDFAPLTTVNWRTRTADGSVYSFNDGGGDYFYTTNSHTALYQYMKTQPVKVQTGTKYTDWSEWSVWSTSNPGSETDLRKVEKKTQYKYRYD